MLVIATVIKSMLSGLVVLIIPSLSLRIFFNFFFFLSPSGLFLATPGI